MPETDDGVRGDREDGDGHENGDILGDGNRESGPSGNKMTSFEDVEVDERDSDIGRSDILLSLLLVKMRMMGFISPWCGVPGN